MKIFLWLLVLVILVVFGNYGVDFEKLIASLPLRKKCSIVPDHMKFEVSDSPIRKRFMIKNPYDQSIYDFKFFVEVEDLDHKMVDIGIERQGATPSEAGPEDSVVILGYKSKKCQGKAVYIRNLPPGDFGMFLTLNESGKAIVWKPEYSLVDKGVGIQPTGEINFQDVAPKIIKSQDGVLEGMKVMLFKR